jgi:hypothetical protein
MFEPRKELPVPLRKRNEIGRVSSPRDLQGVCPLGEKQIDDAFRSIIRCDMKGCPSVLVLGVDVGLLRKKSARRRKRLV